MKDTTASDLTLLQPLPTVAEVRQHCQVFGTKSLPMAAWILDHPDAMATPDAYQRAKLDQQEALR